MYHPPSACLFTDYSENSLGGGRAPQGTHALTPFTASVGRCQPSAPHPKCPRGCLPCGMCSSTNHCSYECSVPCSASGPGVLCTVCCTRHSRSLLPTHTLLCCGCREPTASTTQRCAHTPLSTRLWVGSQHTSSFSLARPHSRCVCGSYPAHLLSVVITIAVVSRRRHHHHCQSHHQWASTRPSIPSNSEGAAENAPSSLPGRCGGAHADVAAQVLLTAGFVRPRALHMLPATTAPPS